MTDVNYFFALDLFWNKVHSNLLNLKHSEIALYLLLLHEWNSRKRPDSFQLSNTYIMSSLNIRHNQTLKNYRKKLIELRLINIEKYEGLTHKYSIIITPSISDRVTPSKSDRVNDTTLSKNDTYKAQYMSKNDRVPPLLYKEREDIDIDQYFEKFWNLYPRKIGKAAAKKKFEKINPDNKLLNKMMNAVSQQKRTDQWQNEKFIPHPTTWLNQERWNDEINTENLSHDQAVRLCTEFGLKLSKDFKYIDKNQYIRND